MKYKNKQKDLYFLNGIYYQEKHPDLLDIIRKSELKSVEIDLSTEVVNFIIPESILKRIAKEEEDRNQKIKEERYQEKRRTEEEKVKIQEEKERMEEENRKTEQEKRKIEEEKRRIKEEKRKKTEALKKKLKSILEEKFKIDYDERSDVIKTANDCFREVLNSVKKINNKTIYKIDIIKSFDEITRSGFFIFRNKNTKDEREGDSEDNAEEDCKINQQIEILEKKSKEIEQFKIKSYLLFLDSSKETKSIFSNLKKASLFLELFASTEEQLDVLKKALQDMKEIIEKKDSVIENKSVFNSFEDFFRKFNKNKNKYLEEQSKDRLDFLIQSNIIEILENKIKDCEIKIEQNFQQDCYKKHSPGSEGATTTTSTKSKGNKKNI